MFSGGFIIMALANELRLGNSIFWHLIILMIISPINIITSSQDSDSLLLLKKSFINTGALHSWSPGSEPCASGKQWVGLICENGMVTGLRLEKMGLSGTIDMGALSKMPNLRSLSITNNSFGGPIPQLNKMGALKAVFFSANQFSGDIPSHLFTQMASLKKLWLSHNNFTGVIPSSLANLSHLSSLHLNNNLFSGAIPEFQHTTLISLDLSNNNLQGEIPQSLSRKFNASSFSGNSGLCGEILGVPCYTADSNNTFAFVLMIVSLLILAIMVFAILAMRRKQEKSGGFDKENVDESVGTVGWRASSASKKDIDRSSSSSTRKSLSSRRGSSRHRKGIGDLVLVNDDSSIVFGMPDLMKAAAEVLGNGSVGSSYKVMLPNGLTVVVKRFKEMNKLGADAFEAEITCMAELKHPNILTPLAYHYGKEEKLLVFEYISKGSLLYILHGDRGPSHAELKWPVRLKIIKGIARGLNYLNSKYASSDLPHGDLKSSNVLIASNYEPLLADYGLNSFISSNQVTQTLLAYKSPEVTQGHHVSPKSDVYCLGIIILEVITGKFPCQYLNHGNGGTDIVEWVKSAALEGREADLVDPEIITTITVLGEMQRLLQIGAACAENNPEQRLDIREATRRIEEIQIEGAAVINTTFDIAPSLRDGCGDAPPLQSHGSRNAQNRQNNCKEKILQQNGDSFAFHIS